MIDLLWLNRFPKEQIEEGIKVLEKVYWSISIKQMNDILNVYAGEVLIFRTDSKEALNAFLYGMALTYVSIDQTIVDSYRMELKKWIEG
jgi:hypothetical protein